MRRAAPRHVALERGESDSATFLLFRTGLSRLPRTMSANEIKRAAHLSMGQKEMGGFEFMGLNKKVGQRRRT
jgi:hypothetical protein